MWIDHILFIHSSVNGHLSCFQLSAFVHSIAVNVRIRVFVLVPGFSYFAYIPKPGIAGCRGIPVNFLRKGHNDSHSNCMLHIPNNGVKVPISLHSHLHLFSGLFMVLIMDNLVGVTCLSLMVNDTDHLSICLLAIFISSLKRCLLKSLTHVKNLGCLSFCCGVLRVLCMFSILYDLRIISSPIL